VKFEARFGEETFEISVTELPAVDGCRQLEVTLRNAELERRYQVELLGRHRDRWTFKVDHAIQDFIISQTSERTVVDWNHRLFPIEISSSRQRSRPKAGGEEVGGETALRAQMPGKIIQVLKSVGDPVEKGEGVVVMEAMKMQNEITSPRTGTIVGCELREGDSVSAGDVLCTIE